LFASAVSPILILIGILVTIVGLTTSSVLISLIGVYVVLVFFIHLLRVTNPLDFSTGFEHAFGFDWEKTINQEQKNHFLSGRRILKLPDVRNPHMEQNITYATVPDINRKLLCDVWQPPDNITPSGLAFIYLHGSAFYFLDKDYGTRPFFRHLAAQGHVIMDVAYRLSPETDIMGMIHDIKRAIAWMKENAGTYGNSPNRIVLGGGSAGGHLALLAAYTADSSQFTPNDLQEKDVKVCAAISL
jgi:acetyl esterase/lipase